MMKEEHIKNIIDSYLNKCVESGFNQFPVEIEIEMSDPNQDTDEE
jgi:hypothetical protein